MVSLYLLLRLLLWLTLGGTLIGCTLKYAPKSAEDFSRETALLEKMIHEQEEASRRPDTHLQLAWLYSNSKNPKMDYKKSLKEFEAYLSLVPEAGRADDIQNWTSILRELERSENEHGKLREQIEMLQKDIGTLTREIAAGKEALEKQVKKNKKLQENIEKLQETIKRLKALDRQMEEKRKSIK